VGSGELLVEQVDLATRSDNPFHASRSLAKCIRTPSCRPTLMRRSSPSKRSKNKRPGRALVIRPGRRGSAHMTNKRPRGKGRVLWPIGWEGTGLDGLRGDREAKVWLAGCPESLRDKGLRKDASRTIPYGLGMYDNESFTVQAYVFFCTLWLSATSCVNIWDRTNES
jgi:hypothetical protein